MIMQTEPISGEMWMRFTGKGLTLARLLVLYPQKPEGWHERKVFRRRWDEHGAPAGLRTWMLYRWVAFLAWLYRR